MKILSAIIALLTVQAFVISAQENSKKNSGEKNETVVPIIKQTGSLRFRCLTKPEIFQYGYYLEKAADGNETCVNPVDLLKVDFEKQTLIGYQVSGDCHIRARTEVFRNDAAKTVRVRIIKKSGKCRAVGDFQGWTVVEKIPQDYKAEFTETNAAESDDFKTELLEENLSLTEDAQKVDVRNYEMNRCINYFRRGEIILRSEAALLEETRGNEIRKECLNKLEKINFKQEILIGITIYSGYCRYPNGLKHSVMRDDRKKRYVVFITYDDPYGRTCRALGIYDFWLAAPKPPDDYEIKIEVASVLNKKYDY